MEKVDHGRDLLPVKRKRETEERKGAILAFTFSSTATTNILYLYTLFLSVKAMLICWHKNIIAFNTVYQTKNSISGTICQENDNSMLSTMMFMVTPYNNAVLMLHRSFNLNKTLCRPVFKLILNIFLEVQ